MREKLPYVLVTGLLLAILFQTGIAQNNASYWSVAGNSNATPSSKLGTTNSTPLRLFTNNLERLRIDASGKVGIGATTPRGKLTVGNGGVPAAAWVTTAAPVFVSYAETNGGNGDHILAMASNTVWGRANMIGRRARGTLAAPLTVANNDYIISLQASAYDGAAFQNAANVDFFADGTPSPGNVPTRISLATGSNLSNRTERLRIGSTGNIALNTDQLFVQQATGNVGIGTTTPSEKFHVVGEGLFRGSLTVDQSYTGEGNPALTVIGFDYGATALSVEGGKLVVGSQQGIGNSLEVNGPATVSGYEGWPALEAYGEDIGIYSIGRSTGGGSSITGVYGVAEVFEGDQGYGIYGNITGSGSSDSYAGYFNGDVYAPGIFESSDRSLKQDIADMTSGLDVLKKLQPKSYSYRQDGDYKLMNLPKGKRYGLIAQDVEQVLPHLVKTTAFNTSLAARAGKKNSATQPAVPDKKLSFKALNYTELIPIVIKAVQELDEKTKEIDALKARIDKLEALLHANTGTTLSAASLAQAIPNPAKGNTRISYSLPSGASRAQLLLTDATGKLLKSITLNTSGTVNLDVTGLSSGVYHYSLAIDGKIAETKKITVIR